MIAFCQIAIIIKTPGSQHAKYIPKRIYGRKDTSRSNILCGKEKNSGVVGNCAGKCKGRTCGGCRQASANTKEKCGL